MLKWHYKKYKESEKVLAIYIENNSKNFLLVKFANDSLVDLTDCIERGVYSHRLVRDLSDLPMRLAKFTNRKFLEKLNKKIYIRN